MNESRSHSNKRDLEDMKAWLIKGLKQFKTAIYINKMHLLKKSKDDADRSQGMQ